ncbi:hypothetical protein BCR32DRAFT_277331 [Anaeromyces robustus]|uniref:Uncharacterized protein n=1 Tax=Anaeromyces robustus TaxID=1754192 RepID=A0A1Y1XES1_9FUNG|nr:hypothetical protein BCR32DRAFT_277331 [Anaeromyces robustus]|eukprot:ORX84260.1 hypothetical protein BCR32DRAFT_277331 [Anaeromyces robustus]
MPEARFELALLTKTHLECAALDRSAIPASYISLSCIKFGGESGRDSDKTI